MSGEQGGVIWITGFSGAGKTTVGRKVEAELRRRGARTVLLDGDDLRRIFAGKWGYEREARLEVSRVYFRLCNHLASQRSTVIISAIAMYAEIFDWVKQNIARSMIVYLRVPDDERLRRDRQSKRVYGEITAEQTRYDEPRHVDLLIDNFGATDAPSAARAIVAEFLGPRFSAPPEADHGKRAYWDAQYRGQLTVQRPSPFALEVAGLLGAGPARILEVGCGDGRDAACFSEQGHLVTAIDTAGSAIDACRRNLGHRPISFRNEAIDTLAPGNRGAFDAVYCRFALHAMTPGEEADFLQGAREVLADGGHLFVECRSINDPLSRLGEVISPTERIHGHYRRFIVLEELEASLRATGFAVESIAESRGWAVHGVEDPVVIRARARRVPAGRG